VNEMRRQRNEIYQALARKVLGGLPPVGDANKFTLPSLPPEVYVFTLTGAQRCCVRKWLER
jgi:hypothetical protein